MDLALMLIRSVVTVALFLLFVALCLWAWSSRRRDEFAAAARLPFEAGELERPASAAVIQERIR
jgi:cytochrome c oxidase cbb3-type subunit 4